MKQIQREIPLEPVSATTHLVHNKNHSICFHEVGLESSKSFTLKYAIDFTVFSPTQIRHDWIFEW